MNDKDINYRTLFFIALALLMICKPGLIMLIIVSAFLIWSVYFLYVAFFTDAEPKDFPSLWSMFKKTDNP